MKIFPLLFALLLAASAALAAPTITCHCFQDRSFDPQRPAAADPYILATAQNSLLAASFDLPKKDVVRAKMAGASGDRLWVVHYLAARFGRPAEDFEGAQEQTGGWQEALTLMRLDPAVLSPRFVAALTSGGGDEALAAAAADAALKMRLGAESEVVDALRESGASTQETILSVFLARRTGRNAVDLRRSVASGNSTWGDLLARVGMAPAALGDEIARMAD